MLSRVANNLYWMARYIERAENTARLVNVNTHLLLDLPRHIRPGWEPIIDITGSRPLFFAQHQEADERSVVRFLVASLNNPGSLLSSLYAARENARTTRDFIPREVWEQVNQLYLFAKEQSHFALVQRSRYEFLNGIIRGVQTMTGMLSGAMMQDEGYDFLRLGRNLERADMTTRIIDVRSMTLLPELHEDLTPFENIQWMSVLKSLTAYQMYRRAMQVRVRRPDVLRFLLQERCFPRSFYHAICEAEACLRQLPRPAAPLVPLHELQDKVRGAKPDLLRQDELHSFIDELQLGLIRVNDAIVAAYF
jgi:uncharacterized alpha-E superfamily protein